MFKIKEKIIITIIFIFILGLRIPYINNSPYETGERWRQSDTESIARNFVEYKFNIFYPQLNYDGPMPNYVQLEFQITTYIIAILYKIFGYKYWIARLVPISFFMGSCFFLYLISKTYYSIEKTMITLIFYGIFPINIFFSRAIMPESGALFFYLGAFYYFIKWTNTSKIKYLYISSIFTALAISQKIPIIFVGIPMIVIALKKYKTDIFKIKEIYYFGIISLGFPLLYFTWAKNIAEFKFVSNIASKHIFLRMFTDFLTKEALEFFKSKMIQGYTLQILLLFLIGIFMINWEREFDIGIWLLAMILEFILIVAVIRLYYYLIFISPLIAIIASKPLSMIWKHKYGGVWISLIIMWIGITTYKGLIPYYIEKVDLIKQADMVKKYTKKEDLIVVGTQDPALINASERKGWRANIKYYDYIPKDLEKEIEYYINNGAKYFVPMKGWIYNDNGEYKRYLDNNFKKIKNTEGYYIYKLK
ncbi:ArnT family glycosyltransferase [Defluviitalea phaphyphila]|uniref:ArnT family glycosyltransferase n=1 Tax=Defluviitalea phaphyphila TaxID=1473580 RepID=UPI00073183A7|nr:glycosyltransferase family 39 protein [Defluviitalea phaphyphila]